MNDVVNVQCSMCPEVRASWVVVSLFCFVVVFAWLWNVGVVGGVIISCVVSSDSILGSHFGHFLGAL